MPTDDEKWINPQPPKPLSGAEAFSHLNGVNVADFWRFALADLKTNNARGYLAEFLVHQAIGSTAHRVEWDSHDAETEDGLRIEVKTSAYLQAWEQPELSRITFNGLRSKRWNPRTGYAEKETYNADIYVFCHQTARTHEAYDPLDLTQWDFYVLPRDVLIARNQQSMSLSTVRKLAGLPISYTDLATAISAAEPRG
ncbi:hypothetical protein [Streptomyces sp. NRRL S-1868]|uniref:hypothetical protein n=1 Tax=Streptomyces sp. NRRL S-1868 TaxID=1463892 RepID=UPI0007C820EA|nr:hypothetical protein [Streptomyces sp. NRRL S-1868]